MANDKRLIVLDYNAIRDAFDREFMETMQLIRSGETHLDNLAEGFTEADRVIQKMPTVYAVPVVRCKDCKHFRPCEEIEGESWTGWCAYGDFHADDLDFCSRGERKTDEQQI